jgi:hypothetical protein
MTLQTLSRSLTAIASFTFSASRSTFGELSTIHLHRLNHFASFVPLPAVQNPFDATRKRRLFFLAKLINHFSNTKLAVVVDYHINMMRKRKTRVVSIACRNLDKHRTRQRRHNAIHKVR